MLNEFCSITLLVVASTEKALLLTDECGTEAWVPRSQIENGFDDYDRDGCYDFEINNWILEQKGFV